MIQWLSKKTKDAPPEAARESVEPSAEQSKVTSNVPRGSAVLAGPKGLVRLTWKKGQREHYLPAGAYRIRNLRVVEKKGKETWFLSSTQPKGAALRVEAGSPLKLRLSPMIRFGAKAKWKGSELRLAFGIRDAQGRGLTIYRAGKRVPLRYEILSASGKRLQVGKMNYG